MDENAANLASAAVTFNFGQLPEYIDKAKSRLLRPLSPGRHSLHVVADRSLGDGKVGRVVTDYALRVLPRLPNSREIAVAPDDRLGDALNVNRTPLTFRSPTK